MSQPSAQELRNMQPRGFPSQSSGAQERMGRGWRAAGSCQQRRMSFKFVFFREEKRTISITPSNVSLLKEIYRWRGGGECWRGKGGIRCHGNEPWSGKVLRLLWPSPSLRLKTSGRTVILKQGWQADQALRKTSSDSTQSRLIGSTQRAKLIIYLRDFSKSKAS